MRIKDRPGAGKLSGRDKIGLRVGKVVNQYKVATHFALTIGDDTFTFARRSDTIAAAVALEESRAKRPSTGSDVCTQPTRCAGRSSVLGTQRGPPAYPNPRLR